MNPTRERDSEARAVQMFLDGMSVQGIVLHNCSCGRSWHGANWVNAAIRRQLAEYKRIVESWQAPNLVVMDAGEDDVEA